jgi:hypothetical protein
MRRLGYSPSHRIKFAHCRFYQVILRYPLKLFGLKKAHTQTLLSPLLPLILPPTQYCTKAKNLVYILSFFAKTSVKKLNMGGSARSPEKGA